MATENGVPAMKTIRQYIDTLWDRRHYLLDKIEDKKHHNVHPGFELAEVAAIEFALDLMEAEWANYRRINENMHKVSRQLGHAERYGIDPRKMKLPVWETA